jgi:hypothetical protein
MWTTVQGGPALIFKYKKKKGRAVKMLSYTIVGSISKCCNKIYRSGDSRKMAKRSPDWPLPITLW